MWFVDTLGCVVLTYTTYAFSTLVQKWFLAHSEDTKKIPSALSIRYSEIIFICAVATLSSLVCCLLTTLVHDYEGATYTHCHSSHFLPSISSVLGTTKSRFVTSSWKFVIAATAPQRLFDAFLFSKMYSHKLKWVLYLGLIEQCGLVTLSFISSNEDLDIHVVSFASFVFGSILKNCLITLMQRQKAAASGAVSDCRSAFLKLYLNLLNIGTLLLALGFYFAHEWYCPEFFYSLFAIFEWVFVLSNIAFNFTALVDFDTYEVTLNIPSMKQEK